MMYMGLHGAAVTPDGMASTPFYQCCSGLAFMHDMSIRIKVAVPSGVVGARANI